MVVRNDPFGQGNSNQNQNQRKDSNYTKIDDYRFSNMDKLSIFRMMTFHSNIDNLNGIYIYYNERSE